MLSLDCKIGTLLHNWKNVQFVKENLQFICVLIVAQNAIWRTWCILCTGLSHCNVVPPVPVGFLTWYLASIQPYLLPLILWVQPHFFFCSCPINIPTALLFLGGTQIFIVHKVFPALCPPYSNILFCLLGVHAQFILLAVLSWICWHC